MPDYKKCESCGNTYLADFVRYDDGQWKCVACADPEEYRSWDDVGQYTDRRTWRNPSGDEERRRLERAAREGDPAAQLRLSREIDRGAPLDASYANKLLALSNSDRIAFQSLLNWAKSSPSVIPLAVDPEDMVKVVLFGMAVVWRAPMRRFHAYDVGHGYTIEQTVEVEPPGTRYGSSSARHVVEAFWPQSATGDQRRSFARFGIQGRRAVAFVPSTNAVYRMPKDQAARIALRVYGFSPDEVSTNPSLVDRELAEHPWLTRPQARRIVRDHRAANPSGDEERRRLERRAREGDDDARRRLAREIQRGAPLDPILTLTKSDQAVYERVRSAAARFLAVLRRNYGSARVSYSPDDMTRIFFCALAVRAAVGRDSVAAWPVWTTRSYDLGGETRIASQYYAENMGRGPFIMTFVFGADGLAMLQAHHHGRMVALQAFEKQWVSVAREPVERIARSLYGFDALKSSTLTRTCVHCHAAIMAEPSSQTWVDSSGGDSCEDDEGDAQTHTPDFSVQNPADDDLQRLRRLAREGDPMAIQRLARAEGRVAQEFTWTPGSIRIEVRSRGKTGRRSYKMDTIHGEIAGPWAVHPSPTEKIMHEVPGYSITHTGNGLALGQFLPYDEAKAIVERYLLPTGLPFVAKKRGDELRWSSDEQLAAMKARLAGIKDRHERARQQANYAVHLVKAFPERWPVGRHGEAIRALDEVPWPVDKCSWEGCTNDVPTDSRGDRCREHGY